MSGTQIPGRHALPRIMLGLLAPISLLAQTQAADPIANVKKAMADSIARQKASAARQVGGSPSDTWFTTPWPSQPIESLGPIPVLAPVQAQVQAQVQVQAPCDPLPVAQVDGLVKDASAQHGLKEDLLRAVMERESAFRPCAVSSKGAQGLMQLMPSTAQDLGVSDAFDPKQNVHAGAKFLKQLLERYGGNVELALSAYNAGPARVDQAGGIPNIPETKDYLTNILGKLIY